MSDGSKLGIPSRLSTSNATEDDDEDELEEEDEDEEGAVAVVTWEEMDWIIFLRDV